MNNNINSDNFNPDWSKAILPLNSNIGQAIKCLDESKIQIVLVCEKNDILVGTITDGDIRRGLLNGLNLQSSISFIIKYDAFVATPPISREIATKLMYANKIHQLPIVDETRRVLGLVLLDHFFDLPKQRNNTIVIMAGGKGIRMRPHTENCPKPMLAIAGKPILEHIIERAKSNGFFNFIIAVHYLGHMIEDYFKDGSKWDVKISYVREKSPLGTAGALGLISPKIKSSFIVTNADVITDIDYGELLDFHILNNSTATMAVSIHDIQQQFGVVKTNGLDILSFEEKPIIQSKINAGIYVLSPEALNLLEVDCFCDMPDLFTRVKYNNQRTVAYPLYERWRDVGRPEDLDKINYEIKC
jgi:dTDP-glucose pyrophosphorylase